MKFENENKEKGREKERKERNIIKNLCFFFLGLIRIGPVGFILQNKRKIQALGPKTFIKFSFSEF